MLINLKIKLSTLSLKMFFLALTSSLSFLFLWITTIFLGYKYFTRNFDYWKKRGVHASKPLPFFGHFYDIATFKLNLFQAIKKLYDETDQPFFGIFAFDKPVLVIKSPELIKDILIKDFNTFSNRTVAEAKHNIHTANCIFMQKNPKWKNTRSKLTSLFSSSMTKVYFTEIQLISKRFVEFLTKLYGPVDAKYVSGHFSCETIARCFFATDPKCFEPKTSKFRHYVHGIFEYNLRNAVIQTCFFLRQSWVDFFKLTFMKHSAMAYFAKKFLDAMEYRKAYNGKPVNMIDMVNELQKKYNGHCPDLDLHISNAMTFLVAGQETISATLAYGLYELALHPDIQKRLRDAIKENYKMYNDITYEGIQKNRYLDMVINEILRKYSILPYLDREAITDYRLRGTDIIIEKGMSVYIPLFAVMRDAKYFPNPEKFDPERFANNNFNDELIFFPFGEGPRNCIGKRLGLLTVASCLSHILLNFKIERTANTPDPLEFEPKSLLLQAKGGLPVKFVSCNNNVI